jgi:hypothetical protein
VEVADIVKWTSVRYSDEAEEEDLDRTTKERTRGCSLVKHFVA